MKNPKQAICEVCYTQFIVKPGTVGRACSPKCGQILAAQKIYCSSLLTKQTVVIENLAIHEKIYLDPATNKKCKCCFKELPYKKRGNAFCNRSCSATFNNKQKQKKPLNTCVHCGLPTKRKYCSNSCSIAHNRKYTPAESVINRKNKVREASAKYRASLKNQTPINVDRKSIQEFYANCPHGYEVDHIIPISKGGLHTLENLQYLTIKENRSKGSKIIN